ncbi:hypothetical protein IF2G_08177 [Cordyceps javanica]|nr:hypothetical protein IF2G_08177 [Cordyceps javanica]
MEAGRAFWVSPLRSKVMTMGRYSGAAPSLVRSAFSFFFYVRLIAPITQYEHSF